MLGGAGALAAFAVEWLVAATGNTARELLDTVATIAVLGAHRTPSKPAHFVPNELGRAGYQIYPVNPVFAGDTLFGREVVATLADLQSPVDLVLVFRRAEHLPAHAEEILALDRLPKAVWFQLGIREDAAAQSLEAQGIMVVQDRCMWVDYRRFKRSRER